MIIKDYIITPDKQLARKWIEVGFLDLIFDEESTSLIDERKISKLNVGVLAGLNATFSEILEELISFDQLLCYLKKKSFLDQHGLDYLYFSYSFDSDYWPNEEEDYSDIRSEFYSHLEQIFMLMELGLGERAYHKLCAMKTTNLIKKLENTNLSIERAIEEFIRLREKNFKRRLG